MIVSFAERLQFEVLNYRREPVGDPYDDNMLDAIIRVQAEDFTAQVNAVFIVMELESLLESLRSIYTNLDGCVSFTSQREHLRLNLTGDGIGHIACSGELSSDFVSNRAKFHFGFDQTDLNFTIGQLEEVIYTFPVRR